MNPKTAPAMSNNTVQIKEKSIKQREQYDSYVMDKASKEKEEMWKWIAEVLNEQNLLKASVLDKMNSKF